MRVIFSFFVFSFIFFSFFSIQKVFGAELLQDKYEIHKARVINILEEGFKENTGLDKEIFYQETEFEILNGKEKGERIVLENDFSKLKTDEKVYLLKVENITTGIVSYVVHDVDRIPWIIIFTIIFIILVVYFGGWPGARGMISLFGSLFLIFYILLPQIVKGADPLLMSIFVASLIVILGSYVTHGFNKTTTSAVIGMIITVIISGLLAYISVYLTKLTGSDTDEAIYLSLNSYGNLDLRGLLMGGIIIGLLGALYDSAIAQSVAVEELWRANPNLSKKYVLKRTLRIGREHIGALVNTLAIAYVGAALPLLVFFSFPSNTVGATSIFLINREMFATEIIRTLIGSIGLVLAVPITSVIAVFMLHGTKWDTKDHEDHHPHVHTHSH